MNFKKSADSPAFHDEQYRDKNAELYAELQANEGAWYDLDLTAAGIHADQSFLEIIGYIKRRLGEVRGCQALETVAGGAGKPYLIRLTSGLKVPGKQKSRVVVDDEGQAWDADSPGEGYR